MRNIDDNKKAMQQAIQLVGWFASKRGELVIMTVSDLKKGIKATGVRFNISKVLISRALIALGYQNAFYKGRWGYLVNIATEGVKKVNGPG